MTFKPLLYEQVLDGSKTVTRRLSCRLEPGRDYAIQPGRGKHGHPTKRMRVICVRREALAWVCDEAEAHREGFPSVADFVAYWQQMHGLWDPVLLVYRIEFEVIDVA